MAKKKNKGVVFLLLSCMLLLVAGGWYIYNIVEDHSAGQKSAEILKKMNDLYDSPTQVDESTAVILIDGEAFCGRVKIPKLNIELPIYDEWNYTKLKTAPCRYAGGITTNNMIIAAHNYKSHFGSLGDLEFGDEIQFIDAYRKVHLYQVCEITTLGGTAVSDMQSGGWDFTLFTCTKGGEQRVTVRCKRIE